MVSLMNGLSALGAGVAQFAGQAGLEQQKADLAQQQTVLADQLATTRETGLQKSAGDIAATAAAKEQTFQTGLHASDNIARAANVAAEQAGANTRNTATIASEMARTQATINAPPETVKLLRALGVQLPGAASPTETAPAAGSTGASAGASGTSGGVVPPLPGPRATGGTAADGSAVPPLAGSSPPTGISTATTSVSGQSGTASGDQARAGGAPMADPMDNPIVQKALGYPAAGSEDALRRAVAADVKSDPAFRYKTAGQQATETELRVNVAKGAMTSPETQAANAAMIASYQIKPPDGFALSRPGAAETMAMVSKFNPDYQESRFPEINKAMSAFGPGQQGNVVRSLDVGVQHLDVFDQAAAALGNGDVRALNGRKNWFQQQFGVAAPTTLEGLKQIVGTEIEKAVAGGIGTGADRDRLMKSLDSANSPAQLQAMTDGFRALMAGQLDGLKRQYENDTGFKTGAFAFEKKLAPATLKALASPHPVSTTDLNAPSRNAPMTGQQMYGGSALAAAPAAPTAAPAARTTPAAPVDPADRKADTPYALPGGKLGMWRGNGWQVIQ